MGEGVSAYEPREYWNARAIQNGALYVAKWCAQEHYQREYDEFEPCLMALVPKRGRLLDFGCGSGRFTWLLREIADEYVGADIAPEGIDIATERYPTSEFWEIADRIPDLDATFDSVVTVMVLQHMVEWGDYVHWCTEFARVLKPGGSLVVIDRDPWPEGSPLAHMNPRGTEAIETASGLALVSSKRANVDHWVGRFVR